MTLWHTDNHPDIRPQPHPHTNLSTSHKMVRSDPKIKFKISHLSKLYLFYPVLSSQKTSIKVSSQAVNQYFVLKDTIKYYWGVLVIWLAVTIWLYHWKLLSWKSSTWENIKWSNKTNFSYKTWRISYSKSWEWVRAQYRKSSFKLKQERNKQLYK